MCKEHNTYPTYISKKLEENNALLNLIEKLESMVTTHREDVSTFPLVEDQEYEGIMDELFFQSFVNQGYKHENQSFDEDIKGESLHKEHNLSSGQVYEEYMDEEENQALHKSIEEEELQMHALMVKTTNVFFLILMKMMIPLIKFLDFMIHLLRILKG